MTPTEYKNRYIASQPDLPQDLDIDLTSFIEYDDDQLSKFSFNNEVLAFLRVGLPEEAAPYLAFNKQLEYLKSSAKFVVIGSNGYGDDLCVHEDTGRVVYFNHDDGLREVLINSSFPQFCHTLCLFSESLRNGYSSDFISDLSKIDQPASDIQAMWHNDFLMMSEN